MLHGGLNLLRSEAGAIAAATGGLLAAHGRYTHFRFDLGHGTGKKSP